MIISSEEHKKSTNFGITKFNGNLFSGVIAKRCRYADTTIYYELILYAAHILRDFEYK
jgi:hypothetical protein